MVSAEKIAELESKHGSVKTIDFTNGSGAKARFVFRLPTRGQYKMWRAAMRKEDPEAIERLVVGMCVSHSHDEFSAFLDAPGNYAAADLAAVKLDAWITGAMTEVGKD